MPIVRAATYSALRPGPRKIFFRTFLPWQLVRFAWVNLRMTVMILKSHGGRND